MALKMAAREIMAQEECLVNFFIVLFGFLGVAPSSKGAAELWKPWN